MRPRERSRPSSSRRRRPRPELAAAVLLLAVACATARLPAPGVAEKARGARVLSGSLRVSVRGPELRGRSRALVAFRRPDEIRIEIPGPSGARLVAVHGVGPARGGVARGARGARERRGTAGARSAPRDRTRARGADGRARRRRGRRARGATRPTGVRRCPARPRRAPRRHPPRREGRRGRARRRAAPGRLRARRPRGCRAIDADEARRLLEAARWALSPPRRSPRSTSGLEVLGVRDDGYHELRTLFQTIDLADEIVLAPLPARRARRVRPPARADGRDATSPRAPRELLRGYARVAPGRRDPDQEAHPRGRRARRGSAATPPRCCWASTACGSSAWGPTACTGWPVGWAPTCPIFLLGRHRPGPRAG